MNESEKEYEEIGKLDKIHREITNGIPLTGVMIKFYLFIIIVAIVSKLLFNF